MSDGLALIPEGWVLVPARMTLAMEDAWRNSPGLSCSLAYDAMLDAVDYTGIAGSAAIPVAVDRLDGSAA
jgi:hypothetical protein